MKRYEQFNKAFNTNESPEMKSFGMIIAAIQNEYDIDLKWCKSQHEAQIEWLNEEVGE